MKIFLSWSGNRSKMVALALRDWLPKIYKGIRPWMSEKDIFAGERWRDSLAAELSDSDFCVLCLTKDNISSDWLLFEAGAIAKAVAAHVVPYGLDVNINTLTGPLSQFQGVRADKEGTLRLLRSINNASHLIVDEAFEENRFSLDWPILAKALGEVPPSDAGVFKVGRVLCATTEAFIPQGADSDIKVLSTYFSDRLRILKPVNRAELGDQLVLGHFDIVHLLGQIDTRTGSFQFDSEEDLSAEDLDRLLHQCNASLVFLATCNSVSLGERLSRSRNVIAAYEGTDPDKWGEWVPRFYKYLNEKQSLWDAYQNAKTVRHLPLILLMKENWIYDFGSTQTSA